MFDPHGLLPVREGVSKLKQTLRCFPPVVQRLLATKLIHQPDDLVGVSIPIGLLLVLRAQLVQTSAKILEGIALRDCRFD